MDFSAILSLFASESRILALYALGSAVSGGMRPDSDIDLAILLEAGLGMDSLARVRLAAEAALILGRDVDLGELTSRNLVYAFEVIMKGRRLFARDVDKVSLIEAGLLGMYARFNEDRREVLDAYRIG